MLFGSLFSMLLLSVSSVQQSFKLCERVGDLHRSDLFACTLIDLLMIYSIASLFFAAYLSSALSQTFET